MLGDEIWTSGIKKNRTNLEDFIGYSRDQGLLESALGVDDFFTKEILGT